MMQLEQLQTEIEALPQSEFTRLRQWIVEKDWEQWDHQIEADAAAGKLDFLFTEALTAQKQGTLRDL